MWGTDRYDMSHVGRDHNILPCISNANIAAWMLLDVQLGQFNSPSIMVYELTAAVTASIRLYAHLQVL
jgi:hypothetical protein